MLDLQNFLSTNFDLKFNVIRDTILFHQIEAKTYLDKLRMVALIAAAKFSIWRLSLSDSDKNLHRNIIWIKACVYFELIADTYIRVQNDIDFWFKVKNALSEWVPSRHPNTCNRQRHRQPRYGACADKQRVTGPDTQSPPSRSRLLVHETMKTRNTYQTLPFPLSIVYSCFFDQHNNLE